jgi:hypothetical protein
MPPTGSTLVLQPVLLFSKLTGTLPFAFGADAGGNLIMYNGSFTWFACFLYAILAYARDAMYIFGSMARQLASPDAIAADQIFHICHDWLFHVFLLTVYVTSFFKFSHFTKLFASLANVDNNIPLANARKIRNISLTLLIAINILDLTQQIYYYFVLNVDASPLTADLFSRILAVIVRCNQNSIDIEFGSFSYVILKFFQQINKRIRHESVNLDSEQANKLRKSFGHLHTATEILNQIYGPCMLFSLCVKGINLQIQLYDLLVKVFNYIAFKEEFLNFAINSLRWIVTNTYRAGVIVWLCKNITAEVSFTASTRVWNIICICSLIFSCNVCLSLF